jgi:hypothetical protein
MGQNLILPSLVEPGFLRGDFGFGLAQIHDAGLAKAGLLAGAAVHVAPELERFQCEGNLPQVAPHGAAPAPVAAGLLPADAAFLAQHDGVAFLGQE